MKIDIPDSKSSPVWHCDEVYELGSRCPERQNAQNSREKMFIKRERLEQLLSIPSGSLSLGRSWLLCCLVLRSRVPCWHSRVGLQSHVSSEQYRSSGGLSMNNFKSATVQPCRVEFSKAQSRAFPPQINTECHVLMPYIAYTLGKRQAHPSSSICLYLSGPITINNCVVLTSFYKQTNNLK